jgi:hypothetical protein
MAGEKKDIIRQIIEARVGTEKVNDITSRFFYQERLQQRKIPTEKYILLFSTPNYKFPS